MPLKQLRNEKMDYTVLAYIVGAIVALWVVKFIIKLPFYLISLAILSATAYAVYRFIWPLLQDVM